MYSRVYHTTDQVIIQRVQYMPTQLSYKGYIFKSTKSVYIIFRSLAHLLAYQLSYKEYILKTTKSTSIFGFWPPYMPTKLSYKEYIIFRSLAHLHAYFTTITKRYCFYNWLQLSYKEYIFFQEFSPPTCLLNYHTKRFWRTFNRYHFILIDFSSIFKYFELSPDFIHYL